MRGNLGFVKKDERKGSGSSQYLLVPLCLLQGGGKIGSALIPLMNPLEIVLNLFVPLGLIKG
jgi:hypothetical protein